MNPERTSRSLRKLEQHIIRDFSAGDIFITHSYAASYRPEKLHDVRRDVRNYIERLRTRAGSANRELKYIYVLGSRETCSAEAHTWQPGWVVHIVMSGIDVDTAQSEWPYGYSIVRQLHSTKEELVGLARYLHGRGSTWRRWEMSRNMGGTPTANQ